MSGFWSWVSACSASRTCVQLFIFPIFTISLFRDNVFVLFSSNKVHLERSDPPTAKRRFTIHQLMEYVDFVQIFLLHYQLIFYIISSGTFQYPKLRRACRGADCRCLISYSQPATERCIADTRSHQKMPNSPISASGLNRNPRNIYIYSSGYDSAPSCYPDG